MTKEFRGLCEKSDARQPEHYEPESTDPMYRGEGRVALNDETGIDVQWFSPTFTLGMTLQARATGRPDLLKPIQAAWNGWAAEQVSGYSDRLQP